MTDADLCMFTEFLVNFMTRDQVEFSARGVTGAMRTALKNLGDDFERIPIDIYYYADYLSAQENKTATRELLFVKMRAIMGYAKIMWGNNSAQVKQFDAGKMMLQDDKKLLTTCRMAVNIAEDYLSDLSPVGLTQAMITDLDTTCQTFEDNLNAISAAVAIRDIKARERITMGNELFSLVQRYCRIGKIIWTDVNYAKYNDYLMY